MGEIIFLTHRVPWPPNRGDKIRSHHILRKLMEYAPVHLACFADDDAEAAETSDLQNDLASCHIVQRTKSKALSGVEALASGKPVSVSSFDSSEIRSFVEDTLKTRPIDCIFVFSGQMAQFVPSDYKGRFVMDFADVDSAKFESYGEQGSGPMAWINRREGCLLAEYEKQIANRADYSLFVSEAEVALFQERSGIASNKITAIGNGIDLDFYDPSIPSKVADKADDPLIVFTGQMDYRPNVEAVTSFANGVMPLILKTHPTARFAIVGRAPTTDVLKLDNRDDIIVTGAVDDIRQWISAADVVVAPLRIARGIQNKVLEAMAMNKPVVASTAAAQGIDAVHGEHFLIAGNIAEEARLVGELLSHPDKAEKLGSAAGDLIRSRYSWEQQLADLPTLCGLESLSVVESAE